MIVDHKNIDLDFPPPERINTEFNSDELAIVDRVFATAGVPDGQDILPGEQAVQVFEGTGLGQQTLREIWQIANVENKGQYLTRLGVALAVRLMGWAQSGKPVSEDLADSPGPLVSIALLKQDPTSSLFSPSVLEPTLAPQADDISKYTKIFHSCNLTADGLVEGDYVNTLFLRSQLPVAHLFAIWELADTKSRGSLDLNEFCIAMHLIRLAMEQKLISIPPALPPELSRLLDGAESDDSDLPPPLPPKPPNIIIETAELPTYNDITPSVNSTPKPSNSPRKPRRPPPAIPPRVSSGSFSGSSLPQPGKTLHTRARSTSSTTSMKNPRPVTSYEPGGNSHPLSHLKRRSISVGSDINSLSPSASSNMPRISPSPDIIAQSSSYIPKPSTSQSPSPPPIPSTSRLSPSSPHIVVDTIPFDSEWRITETDEAIANHYFSRLDIGKRGWLSRNVVDTILVRSDLNAEDLNNIWRLIDPHDSGAMSNPAFIATMTVVRMRVAGYPIPSDLPNALKILDLSPAGSSSSTTSLPTDDPKLSFWLSSTKSHEEETIGNLKTQLDAMQNKIENLESNAYSPVTPLTPKPSSVSGLGPTLFGPDSTIGKMDKGKGRMAWCVDELNDVGENSSGRSVNRKTSSPSLGKRKGSKGKLQRVPKPSKAPPLEKENEILRAKIDDWMLSMSHQERLNDALLKDKDDLDRQVEELMDVRSESSRKTKANEKLRRQLDATREELETWRMRAKQASAQATASSASFEQEKNELGKQAREAEESMARILIANGDKVLARRIKDEKKNNPMFRMTMGDLENHVARVRFDSEDTIATDSATQRIQADLTKENETLRKKTQEMEEALFVMQSAQAGVPQADLHQLVEDLTRENDRIRTEMRELNSAADEMAQLKTEHVRTKRENEILQTQLRELEIRVRVASETVPPPAYVAIA